MLTENQLNDCINVFTEHVRKILGDKLLSAFLYGSVTLGDFKEGWSDIDVIFFTSEAPTDAEADELLKLRHSLAVSEKKFAYLKFEGAVVCFDEFNADKYTKLVYWGTSGQRIRDAYSLDPFSLMALNRYGQLLYGSDVRKYISMPSYYDLAAGIKRYYDTIRQHAQTTNSSIYSCGWLLDIARCIYTLRTGDIICKTRAGEWALSRKLCPCVDEMEMTLKIRRDPFRYMGQPQTKEWLCSLGPSVQKFADVLWRELLDKREYLLDWRDLL